MDPLAGLEDRPFHEKAFAYILVHYRWIFVLLFLLPLSILYDFYHYARNLIVFHLRSAPRKHDERVANVQRQVRAWIDGGRTQKMCTARPGWQTMSFRVPKYKKTHYTVDCNLVDILEIDVERRVVRLEPMVTMGQVTSTLLPLGWSLPIVPELDDLTVGGMVMGTGIETSSHHYGLFQHICEAYELVTADGSVVRCSRSENSDLFYSVPWSYGTLGFLVAAELRIVPAFNFVKLHHKPCYSLDELDKTFREEIEKKEGNDFVEALVFSRDTGVVMTGTLTNQAEPTKVNRIGNFWKPWFYKHVETFLSNGPDYEYIPARHYYHRHSRSIFWELRDIIPFGNNPIFRYLLGWAVPPKVSLLKLTQGEIVKQMYERHQIIQDMLVPVEDMKESIKFFHSELNLYPLWLCPFRLPNDPGMLRTKEKTSFYVDIGAYGTPTVPTFEGRATTRRLEAFVRKVGGFQMLYADTYMTKEEFEEMFDHRLYDRMRNEWSSDAAFPRVFDKVNKNARN